MPRCRRLGGHNRGRKCLFRHLVCVCCGWLFLRVAHAKPKAADLQAVVAAVAVGSDNVPGFSLRCVFRSQASRRASCGWMIRHLCKRPGWRWPRRQTCEVETRCLSCSRSFVMQSKPPLSFSQVINMNVGFFGIQYGFGLQRGAVNPIYVFPGASPDEIPMLNLAGPVTGLIIQPIVAGSMFCCSARPGRRGAACLSVHQQQIPSLSTS